MSWNSNTLACGFGDGTVVLYDVRSHEKAPRNAFKAHVGSHAIAAVQWRDDGRLLLTGGNDNRAMVWDVRMLGSSKGDEPLYKWKHMGCIKVSEVEHCL